VRKLCVIILFISATLNSHAILPPPNNAIALSLGGASATYLSPFAIENNIGALAFCDQGVSLNASNRFGLGEYSNLMLAGNYKTKYASIGVSYQISPFANLTTQKIQLGVSKKLGDKVAAGVTVNYHNFSSIDAYYQTADILTFNAGIYYKINDKLNVGFQIFNPNRAFLTKIPEERFPALFRFGIDYKLAESIKCYADVLQATDEKLDLNAGIELHKDKYTVRGGFGLNQLVAVGFGWEVKNFQIDVTAAYHNQLGFSPSLNLGYAY
jgi:hypothetical protein